jgi:hypothetical protein
LTHTVSQLAASLEPVALPRPDAGGGGWLLAAGVWRDGVGAAGGGHGCLLDGAEEQLGMLGEVMVG